MIRVYTGSQEESLQRIADCLAELVGEIRKLREAYEKIVTADDDGLKGDGS